jgi:uncharacterized protein (TIGR03083 family)
MTQTAATRAADIRPIEKPEAMRLAEVEYDRFTDLLRSLDDADWSTTTVCDGWDVKAMAAHVLGAAESCASLRETVSQWRRGVPLAKQRGLGEAVHGVNEVQIRDRAELTPAQLIRRWEAVAPRAVRGRRRLPPPLRRVPVKFPAPLGRRSLAYLMDIVYTRDVWMHRIDIARATGRDPVLTPEHDGRLVADMVADWANTHGHDFHLELEGAAGGAFVQGRSGEVLRLDAVEWIWIVSGRGEGTGLLTKELPL